MRRTMRRGKQQIMFRLLPGKTFDFERVATIAKVTNVRGTTDSSLNVKLVLQKIAEIATSWSPDYRPSLSNDVLCDENRFILLDPTEAQSEMFPKVLWCQNKSCGKVINCENFGSLSPLCANCKKNSLIQLRFVRVHRCGALQPLYPPFKCQSCHVGKDFRLDTRNSEHIANFTWVCRKCGYRQPLLAGVCNACQWSDGDKRNMQIQVHRAGSTYYAHTTVMLNIPRRDLDTFFSLSDWQSIVAAKFLGLPEVANRKLEDFSPEKNEPKNQVDLGGISGAEMNQLMDKLLNGEMTSEEYIQETQKLHQQKKQEQQSKSSIGIANLVEQCSGLPSSIWENAGQELLEAIMPLESNTHENLHDKLTDVHYQSAITIANRMGLSGVTLVTDFPMLTATFSYSRVS